MIQWYFDNKFLEARQLGSEYQHKKEESFSKMTQFYKEFENDLMVNGLLEDSSGGRMGEGHYYFPSKLCKVIYNFVKY